ncbi:glycosyltransferase family 2 protein [Lutibacter maritimus]|uniref:Glycosyltransferase involved in cell wall bisynthesis n=1 Tax=Lutibacter maritimus TaxID=593133 RepID=A0A1I6SNV3_9FLAO|nr:glycosyltransferase family A protein [Lutibacter maritimus]SFS78606.1 Glycosyltransferase involved in cell wall bisynthesis [Lutibacter maritimus]
MKVFISIIVPCYNQAQFLDEALQSVLAQTYTNWECIIVNDGSPDNTEEIALAWCYKYKRFKYIKTKNKGVSHARNTGIESAIGEYILPLDADDKIGAQYLELAIEAFKTDDSLKVVYCEAEKFGDEIGYWNLEPYSFKKLCHRNVIFCTALFKKRDWIFVGGYDESMYLGWEDWDFWISILKNGGTVKRLSYIGFYYRIKKESRSKNLNKNTEEKIYKYLSLKHVEVLLNQFGSFHKLKNEIEIINYRYSKSLKSRKFAINIFCKNFFGIYMFKNFR